MQEYKKRYIFGRDAQIEITKDKVSSLITSLGVVYVSRYDASGQVTRERHEDPSWFHRNADGTEDRQNYRLSQEEVQLDGRTEAWPFWVLTAMCVCLAVVLKMNVAGWISIIVAVAMGIVAFRFSTKKEEDRTTGIDEQKRKAVDSVTGDLDKTFTADYYDRLLNKEIFKSIISDLPSVIKKAKSGKQESVDAKNTLEEKLYNCQEALYTSFTDTDKITLKDPSFGAMYRKLCFAFSNLQKSSRIWRIDSTQSNTSKMFGSTTVSRSSATLESGMVDGIFSGYDVPMLKVGGKTFYLYPCFIIASNVPGSIRVLEYDRLDIKGEMCEFMETDGIPTDSKVLYYSYTYVNKDGSPDRRYSYNPRHAVMQYIYIVFSVDYRNSRMQFSNVQLANAFISAYYDYRNEMKRVSVRLPRKEEGKKENPAAAPQVPEKPRREQISETEVHEKQDSRPVNVSVSMIRNGRTIPLNDKSAYPVIAMKDLGEEEYTIVNNTAHYFYRFYKQISKKYRGYWGLHEEVTQEEALQRQITADIVRCLKGMGIEIDLSRADNLCLGMWVLKLLNNDALLDFSSFKEQYRELGPSISEHIRKATELAEQSPREVIVADVLSREIRDNDYQSRYIMSLYHLLQTVEDCSCHQAPDHNYLLKVFDMRSDAGQKFADYPDEPQADKKPVPEHRIDLEKKNELTPLSGIPDKDEEEKDEAKVVLKHYSKAILRPMEVSSDAVVRGDLDDELKERISTVIFYEYPINRSLLYRRVLSSLGLARTGQRLSNHMDGIVDPLSFLEVEGFLWYRGTEGQSYKIYRIGGGRTAAEIPIQEAANAVRGALERYDGFCGKDELMKMTARLLGFTKLGVNVADLAGRAIELAVQEGLIKRLNYDRYSI